MKNKRKVIYDRNEPYIWSHHQRLYLKDFSREGYHLLSFTNCGYFLGFRITGFEYDIDDYTIVEKVK